jgi:hypothetical protein
MKLFSTLSSHAVYPLEILEIAKKIKALQRNRWTPESPGDRPTAQAVARDPVYPCCRFQPEIIELPVRGGVRQKDNFLAVMFYLFSPLIKTAV